ncbi:hypothetical protein ACOMHN_025119 [Nucella lapillus]
METGIDVDGLSQYSIFKVRGEDPASLLTSTITFYALLLAGAFLSGMQLIGEPIECWCPAQTSDAMCNYTKSICWISKQYVIDFDEAIPGDPLLREAAHQRQLQFYPMVPFIILMLACLLRLPNFLWTAFQGEEGLNVTKAVQLAANPDRDDEHTGQDIAFEMNFNLTKNGAGHGNHSCWLAVRKAVSAWALFPLGGDIGTYQTGLFLLTRLMVVLVNVLVFPCISYVLQMDFVRWGWSLVSWVVMEDEEPMMHVFPQEILCDFRMRHLQNVHAYTVQCVLPINMWSKKVFLVLWFWLLFLILANVYSYQYWLRKLLVPSNRLALVAKHLAILFPGIKTTRRKHIADFAWNYLSYDSVLVLRILEMAAGNRLANVVVSHLWEEYNRSLEPAPSSDIFPVNAEIGFSD